MRSHFQTVSSSYTYDSCLIYGHRMGIGDFCARTKNNKNNKHGGFVIDCKLMRMTDMSAFIRVYKIRAKDARDALKTF